MNATDTGAAAKREPLILLCRPYPQQAPVSNYHARSLFRAALENESGDQ